MWIPFIEHILPLAPFFPLSKQQLAGSTVECSIEKWSLRIQWRTKNASHTENTYKLHPRKKRTHTQSGHISVVMWSTCAIGRKCWPFSIRSNWRAIDIYLIHFLEIQSSDSTFQTFPILCLESAQKRKNCNKNWNSGYSIENAGYACQMRSHLIECAKCRFNPLEIYKLPALRENDESLSEAESLWNHVSSINRIVSVLHAIETTSIHFSTIRSSSAGLFSLSLSHCSPASIFVFLALVCSSVLSSIVRTVCVPAQVSGGPAYHSDVSSVNI